MKKIIVLVCLLLPVIAFTQYTAQQIKKYKISRIIKYSANTDSSEKQRQDILYDRNGNDTATYLDDQLYKRSVYEYNEKDQPLKKVTYDFGNSENETAIYNYKPDGSYIISNTDKQVGMTDYVHYDKAGKLIKTVAPDHSERLYTYDATGKLLKLKTKPGGGGVLVDIQYTYNPKRQLIKETNKGEYKWSTTYSYDVKGLLSKSVTTSFSGGAETKKYYRYQYEFWK